MWIGLRRASRLALPRCRSNRLRVIATAMMRFSKSETRRTAELAQRPRMRGHLRGHRELLPISSFLTFRTYRMSSESSPVLTKLQEHGLLLQTDANLPNVCALVAGAPVRGHGARTRQSRVFGPIASWQRIRSARSRLIGKMTYFTGHCGRHLLRSVAPGSPGRSSPCPSTLTIYWPKWNGIQSRRIVA